MRAALELFRAEPRARVFFAALAQSSLGTGAGYVALLLLAFERLSEPWAISVVLLADLLPAMALGPVFGAAADRWSRRGCMILGDAVRAVAFIMIALVGSFEATVALALVAGAGTGLFTPSALAALPSLVDRKRLPAATAVFGAIADLGFTAGPAIAAVILVFGGPEALMIANGVTFAISAGALSVLRFGARPGGDSHTPSSSLLAETREGLRVVRNLGAVRAVLFASAAGLFFGGIFNVGELPFARTELNAGEEGFAVLAALIGIGFVAGSLSGSKGGSFVVLKRRFQIGLLVMGLGFLASGLAPVFVVALATFAVAGFGNGMMLVYERLLIQSAVPDRMAGRVFGTKDALTAWAFGTAFVAAGAIVSISGVRGLLVFAGCGAIVVSAITWLRLRDLGPLPAPASRPLSAGAGPGAGRHVAAGQYRSHLVGGRDHWLALLDDLDDRADDPLVELRP